MVPTENTKAIEEMRMKIAKTGGHSKAEMLMARLVDRPENSHVLRMANSHTRREKEMPTATDIQNMNTSNNAPSNDKVGILEILTCLKVNPL